MSNQFDENGLLIHNKVINLEPIRLDFSPFSDNQVALLNSLKHYWSGNGNKLVSIDGITAEQALAICISYCTSTDMLNIIRNYIKSDLFQLDAQATFESYLKFEREFKVIDKQKLIAVLNNPKNISTILTPDEIQILKSQAVFRNIIDSPTDALTGNDLLNTIKYNLYFYEKSPSYYALFQSGVVDKIKEYIGGSGNGTIDETQIINLVRTELETLLKTQVFLPYDKIQEVLASPSNVGYILTLDQFETVLFREATSLQFISAADITAVQNAYDTNQLDTITNIFTTDEIKLMMENEINAKKVLSNMLTFEQVTNFFNDLKSQFFNSDLFGTIDITIDQIEAWISEA